MTMTSPPPPQEGGGHTPELIEAAANVIERMTSTYQARNGRHVGIQGDDGEKCWIVHSDEIEALRAALAKASVQP